MKEVALDFVAAALLVLALYFIGLWRKEPRSSVELMVNGTAGFAFMGARRKYKASSGI